MPSTTEHPAAPDASLDALVPRPSRLRSAVVVAAVVVVVVGAWVVRPGIGPGTGGAWSPLADRTHVLSHLQVTAEAWPAVVVEPVDDVPGAEVVGAWLFVETDAWALTDELVGAEEGASGSSGTDLARDVTGQLDATPSASRLPSRAPHGSDVTIIVLWEVVDCGALVEGAAPPLRLRSALGPRATVDATDRPLGLETLGPAFDLAALAGAGTC